MATEQQMEAIVEQIELLMEVKHLWDATDTNGYPAWKGELPKEGQEALDWGKLDKYEQEDTLRYHIDWIGFTQAQEDDVIRRVIDGEEPEFWMDGVTPESPAMEPIPSPEEAKAIRDEWAQDYALRSTPESVRDASSPEGGMATEAILGDQRPDHGTYQVWNLADRNGQLLLAIQGIEFQPDFPGGFVHVADVRADYLEQAFGMMQDGNWHGDPRVEQLADEIRSTSVGDVIVDPQGQAHRVEGAGFEKILTHDPEEEINESWEWQREQDAIEIREFKESDPEEYAKWREWLREADLREKEEAKDRHPEPSPIDSIMEAIGNSPLPEPIRSMESDYHRMLNEAADSAKFVKRDKDIER